jgi:hypothetical protein
VSRRDYSGLNGNPRPVAIEDPRQLFTMAPGGQASEDRSPPPAPGDQRPGVAGRPAEALSQGGKARPWHLYHGTA